MSSSLDSKAAWQRWGWARAEPILELACVVFGISVAMVALVDGERVFIRNCFGDSAMARPGPCTSHAPHAVVEHSTLEKIGGCRWIRRNSAAVRCQ